jgi:hypothetical protein
MANTGGEAEWSGQAIDARSRESAARSDRPVRHRMAGWAAKAAEKKKDQETREEREKTLAAWAVPFDAIKQDRRKA